MVFPLVQVPGFQEGFHKPQESAIVDFLPEDRQQDVVIDVVEESLDIPFDEPFCSRPIPLDLLEGRMASSIGAETVGVVVELWVVIRFQ